MNKFIYCIGSRRDDQSAAKAVEVYNVELDLWFEVSSLNEGRHYHSSTSFNDKSIFVFCGISQETKKYINSIESFTHGVSKQWELINLNKVDFPQRQGSGVCQYDASSILVLGGFAGKFIKYGVNFKPVGHGFGDLRIDLQTDVFPFQMPTLWDSANKVVYTVDWQTYKLYKHNQTSKSTSLIATLNA